MAERSKKWLNAVEAEFVLESESGTFFIDGDGIVLRFETSNDNPFIEEKIEKKANYTFDTNKSIRTFIVPKGVKGFVSDFMRGIRIIERFELPEGLLTIGNNIHEIININAHCVFADCILPTVVIPNSVKELGSFAFGHSHIDTLQLPKTLYSPYSRQFKDSYIGTLRLPIEWKDNVSLGEYGNLHLSNLGYNNNKYGYLMWPSTRVGNIEFY